MPAPEPNPPWLRLTTDAPLPRVNVLPVGNVATPGRVTLPDAMPGSSPTDARWVFAVRAGRALAPDSGGILPPPRRERLNKEAAALGLRPFDAALIIAIVQDAARTGRDPLGPDTADRLGLVRPPQQRSAATRETLVLAAFLMVVLGCFVMIAMKVA